MTPARRAAIETAVQLGASWCSAMAYRLVAWPLFGLEPPTLFQNIGLTLLFYIGVSSWRMWAIRMLFSKWLRWR